MSDNICTINARDLMCHSGSVKTLYDVNRPSRTMDCFGMDSLEKIAGDIANRQVVYVKGTTYVNMQGFEVINHDAKNPLPDTVVRTVKRGLYQQEWEALQQLLSQQ